jgi:4-hydroxy-tetrahydrodipicolinate synthase
MTGLQLRGALTALVTPLSADGSQVEFGALEKLVSSQLEAGIGGLVACGTTAETPTLTPEEQREVISTVVKLAKGKVPVVAGAGNNDTLDSINIAKTAVEAGADAVMVVMPYYNKPSQEGMVRHVQAIAGAVDVPVVIYNIPGRTIVDLSVESTLRIADTCKNVVAIKDATGKLDFAMDLLSRAGNRLTLLCGDDPLTVPMMSVGAMGVISVTSNVLPAQVQRVTELMLSGDYKTALREHLRLLPVHRSMFLEPNPQPVKAVLAARGMMKAQVRLPLVEAAEETKNKVLAALKAYEAGLDGARQ